MKRKISIALLVFIVTFVSFYCQKKAKIQGVGLEVTFSEPNLSDNLITDVQYKWKIEKEFKPIGRDYMIFVHFWHKNNMLLQDDYTPDLATSKWEPGKEYTYTRRIYIPPFIDEFDPQLKGEESLRLSIGFYSPYDRTGKSEVEVFSKKLKVLPPPLDTPEVIYDSGWYDLEINPEAHLKQWRWTAKEARCIIDNPHRDALLIIRGGMNLDALDQQKVIFKINDIVLDEFIPVENGFEKTYSIKKEMLGDKDKFRFTVTTDQTFIPAKIDPNSKDERELGVAISFIYFR